MAERTLPPFPVDDAALDAVEHSLDASLDFPEGDMDNPVVVGAEFTLSRLLDFYSGHDPDAAVHVGYARDGVTPVYLDENPHYTPHDVIAALIAEVRRLRSVSDREASDG